MTRDDAATILRGLCPQGCDYSRVTREGRQEVRDAVDAVIRLWETGKARDG